MVPGRTAREDQECASCQAVNGILPADGSGCNAHGTHVASTVGGAEHGVAEEVTIVPAFSCFGFPCGGGGPRQCGRGSDIKANLEWVLTDCAAHPEARCVMQRSLSGGFLTEDAALLNANVMVVAAAGNSASDPCTNYYDSDATFNKLLVGSTTRGGGCPGSPTTALASTCRLPAPPSWRRGLAQATPPPSPSVAQAWRRRMFRASPPSCSRMTRAFRWRGSRRLSSPPQR